MLYPSPGARDRLLDRLASCRSFAEIRDSGFLFHGTCEEIAGPLHGGAYDGVFWTAQSPAIAQAYIPRAGISTYIKRPSHPMRGDPVKPGSPDDPVTSWALSRAGATWDDLDVTFDRHRVDSFRILPGWPNLEDLAFHISDTLGYGEPENEIWEISIGRGASGQTFMPADWKLPGTLIILRAEHLNIAAPQWQEEDLGYTNHNRVGAFSRFANEGVQAFRMQDLLQSRYHGNVMHEAIGILPEALAGCDWIGIPATRHDAPDLTAFQQDETAEFTAFMRSIASDYEAAHDEPSPDF